MVLHDEESGDTYIEFVAWYKKQQKYEIVRITFDRCVGSRCYSMGGEGNGCRSIGRVRFSTWLKDLNTIQKKQYPSFPDNFKDVKHYYFTGHDCTVEILAEGFKYKTIQELENW